jgi:hypothetical protein
LYKFGNELQNSHIGVGEGVGSKEYGVGSKELGVRRQVKKDFFTGFVHLGFGRVNS